MASRFAWFIDVDHQADETGTCWGTSGPHNASPELVAKLTQGEGKAFRLFDDDGELYLSGRYVSDVDSEANDETAFAPLWDFARPALGCTYIKYRRGNKWEIL
jgi:hypothetical protein